MRTAVVQVQRQSDLATVVPPACLYFEWDQLLSLELCSSAAEPIVDCLAKTLFGRLLDA